MSTDTQSIGVGTTVVIEGVPITFNASYNTTTLSIEVKSCQLDLAQTAKSRFNDLNVILPENSSKLSIAKFNGSISKTDLHKQLSSEGEYRLIKFEGEMENITIPLPILRDITVDKAFFYYQYLSAKSTTANPNFKEQIVFLGCRLSVKEGSSLSKALTGATLTAAYFLSNNASIVYFDFSGKINLGKIIQSIFGITTVNLTIDIQSAGIFYIAKTNKQKSIPGKNGQPGTKVPEVTYLDALNQIASLQAKSKGPENDSDVTKYMPSTFPLSEKQVIENGVPVTKMGIRVGSDIDTDFPTQFSEAFAGENVTGICFWVMINFNQISLFKSLITIGYKDSEVNSLVLYGFKTENKQTPKETTGSAYFYAQLPSVTILNFLTIGGLHGRQGVLFKYSSNKNQYELNGSIAFDAFGKSFLFGGNLLINDDKLVATLSLAIGSPNSSVDAPLGMTGINFGEIYLALNKTFAKKASNGTPAVKEKLDVSIGGFIDFNFSGTHLQLEGDIVFENSKPRLALVSLNSTPALTLNNFVKEVIKKPWNWVDEITKQIGFISGTMYYLKVPKAEKNNKDYTFSYTNPLQVNHDVDNGGTALPAVATTYKPGYHIAANLLLFEKFVFFIGLDVEPNGMTLKGNYEGKYENNVIVKEPTITAYFISLDSPTLSISTVGHAHFNVRIDKLKLFNTDIGSFSAGYGNGIFNGTYTHSSPSFGFDWQWTKKQGSKGGFSITKINGIQNQDLNAVSQIVSKLNSFTGKGGCESVVNSMFDEFKSSFSPALQKGKSPTDNGNGTMRTPLAINYKFTIAGATITSGTINMTFDVQIPTSLGNLPAALIGTLTNNMGSVIGQLLDQPDVYKAIALEAAKKGGAKLAARMLCKAGEKLAEELAKDLAKALADGLIDAALGPLLELGAVLTGVLAAGIAGAVGGLLGILKKVWDAVKKFFTGDDGKKEAQDKLNTIKRPVQQLITSLENSLNNIKADIQIHTLTAGINDQGKYVLNWDFPNTREIGQNGNLEYKLIFLNGAIGTTGSASTIKPIGFELMNGTSYQENWTTLIQTDPNFRMNASIQTSITGYTFMTPQAEASLSSTIHTMDQIGDSLDGAVQFNNQLKSFVRKMQAYNRNGLTSSVLYAKAKNQNNQFKIGQGALGINTKLD